MTARAKPEIFKAYDIRGVYGDDLDAGTAHLIGRSFARVIGALEDKPTSRLTLGLGRDMRLTAPEMEAAYRDGMVAEGATVLDAGQVGTEMLYFLVGSRELDGGLMCTASHNPKRYTGAKLVGRGALALSGDSGLAEVRDRIAAGLGDPSGALGSVTDVDVYADFQEAALGFVDVGAKPLKVVVDGGNGMAGPMVGPSLERLGLELIEAYFTPDGNFPDHEPNPMLPENREFIIDEVIKRRADLGIAWDGDADRCFFIDETGRFVDGDFLTALMSESMIDKNPGATVLFDVRASRAVADTAARVGGKALMNRVGHAFFKTRMRSEGAVFGGEVSGHYYFRDFYCADSGTLPALLILELLSTRNTTMAQLLEPYRSTYFISGEINTEVSDQQAKLDAIVEHYRDGRRTDLDGISIDYDDWHFNVRSSNTEPLLRLCLESLRSPEHMAEKRDEVLGLIRVASADAGAGAAQPAADDRVAWEAAAADGIHAIALPTPFLVGRVNCYLIEDEPLTLVDTGPNSGTSLDELETRLAALGHRIEDLELIVLTHQHMDHLGLVRILARRSGARVAAWHELAGYLRHFSAAAGADDAFAMTLMRRHGVPDNLATALSVGAAAFRAFGSSGEVDVPLRDGSVLEFAGRSLTALHRPGHSPSDVILHDPARRIVIGGDHLLSRISSNPLMSRPLDAAAGGAGERPHALEAYNDSLRATRALDAGLVLGGHGPPVTDHVALIDERLRMTDRRARKVAGLLQSGPQTAYELATSMWANVAVTQAFLTLSEVLGHLDLLVADGQVIEEDDGGLARFALR